MANQARKAIQDTSGDLSRLGAATAAAGSGSSRFGTDTDKAFKKLGKWGNQLQWTGRQLQYNWTLPIVAAGAAATSFALAQEKAFTRIKKVYGDASLSSQTITNETAALEKAFVALSNRYGVTIEETGNIAAEWAAAGVSGLALAENVEQTMKTMVLGELEAAEATEALIAIQAQYGFSSAELADTIARLNNIENQTGTTMNDLIVGMSRAAGVARSAGIDVSHLGAMIAAMTPAAGSASQAGNALKTMVSRLLSPTGEAADILGEMGINMEDMSWKGANATARMELLAGKFHDLSDSQKAVVSATIASRYNINKFDILMGDMHTKLEDGTLKLGYYEKALRASADGSDYVTKATEELETVMASSPNKMKTAGVIMQNSLIKVIEPLLPTIVMLAQSMANLAQKIGNANPEVIKLVAVGLVALAMLGMMARYVGSVATLISVLGRSFSVLGPAIGFAASGFGLFGKKAEDEMDKTNRTTERQSRGTVQKMRTQLLKGIPGLTGVWTRIRVGAITQMVAMNIGISKRLVVLRSTMHLIWFSIWSRMLTVMAASITAMQARMATHLLPYFGATLAKLRGLMAARWAAIWLQATLMASIGMLGIRTNMALGMAALRARVIAFAGPFRAAWAAVAGGANRLWAKLRFAFVAIDWTVSTLLTGVARKIAAPFAAAWAFVARMANGLWAKLRFGFVAIDWSVRTLLMSGARKFAAPFAAAWGLVARGASGAFRGGLFVMRVIFANFTMGMRVLALTGSMLVGRAWGAGSAFMSRIWGAVLMFMRGQWMAFVMFMRAPGALMGAFKSMGAVIMAGGRGLMGIMAALRTGLVAIIFSPWGIAIALIIGAIILFRDQIAKVWQNIKDYFANANNGIVKAFDALPNGIKGAFLKVIAFVKAAAQKVYEWMQYLNPFARHSPSLVDNVRAGLAVVRSQFGTLTQIAGPISSAYAGIKKLKDATAGLRDGMQSMKLAKDVEELSIVAPQAVGPFRDLAATLTVLEAKAEALDAVITDQEQTVQVWKTSLDEASDALDIQKDILDGLNDVVQNYETQISDLESAISDLADTPLTGMGAMEDKIFDNEMAQKRLRLEIMKMEDAGHTYEDVRNRIASLNGELEGLRGAQADLRAAGAGSDILAMYDDQIKAIEDQKAAMDEQTQPIAEMSKAIDQLARDAERMDLEKALAFDPLTRQIEKAASTMQEMPFEEIIGGIGANRAALDGLESGYTAATAAVAAQERQVAAAQAVHDEIQAGYDRENLKLQVLKDSYDQVTSAISDVTQAMSDMRTATGMSGGEGAISPALENFRAAEGGEFADVGGTGTLGREGGLEDQSALIDEFTKGAEEDLANAFGGMDMFQPIKDMWAKFTTWWDTNVGGFFSTGVMGDFMDDIFEGVDFLKPLEDIWADVDSIFTETDWEGIFTNVWDSVSAWFENIWDFVEIFEEILGPDVMETFYIIRDKIQEWWQNIVDAFTSGEIADTIDTLTGAFDAFWGFVFPILQTLWAVFLMVVQVIWSSVNGVLGPTLDWIGAMFGNIWDIIVGFWDVIYGIFTGDWKRVWDGVKSIFSGAWGLIWDTIKWIGASIIGFIVGFVKGIWDNIVWVWNKIKEFAAWIGGLFVDAFWSAVGAIGNAFDAIKEKARVPIKWVIDFVWNDGLRKLWNKVNNLWGGEDIDRFNFARGGVVPGYRPGKDTVPAMLSPGEGILRPEATRAIGGKEGIDNLNRAARLGGVGAVQDLLALSPQYFADGGIVGIPGWLDSIIDWIPGTGIIKEVIDAINGGQSGAGAGDLGAGLLKIPGEILGKIWDKIQAWWDDDDPKGEGGITGSGPGSQVDRMFRAVQSAFPRAKLNSGQRNTNDMHGRGKAIDIGEQGFPGGAGRPYIGQMVAWIYKHVANISELIYNGIGKTVSNVKNGSNFPYSSGTQADHKNHGHWGQDRFDDGGIMQHGRGGFNTSGRPERVLTPHQTETFDRLLSFLEMTGIPSPAAMEGAIFRATVKANRAEAIGGQTIVNGDLGTTNITNNFYGDLSFPNVSDGNDAETFLQNLGDLAGAR